MSQEVYDKIDALVANGDHEELLALGTELFQFGELPLAERALRAAHDAGSPGAMTFVAITLDTMGRIEEAEAAYRACGDEAVLINMVDMLILDASRHAELEQILRRLIELDVPSAWFVLGKLLRRQPGRQAEAESALAAERYAAVVPGAQLELGRMLVNTPGREAEAERALRASGLPQADYELAGLLGRIPGREDEAVEAMRRAAEGGAANGWTNLTAMLEKLGRSDSTEAAYRDALAAGETMLAVHYGEFLRLQGRLADAEQVLRHALATDPRCAFLLGVILVDDPTRIEEGRELLVAAASSGIADAAIHLAQRT